MLGLGTSKWLCQMSERGLRRCLLWVLVMGALVVAGDRPIYQMFIAKGPSPEHKNVEVFQPVLQPSLYVMQENGEPIEKGKAVSCKVGTRQMVVGTVDGKDATVWEMTLACDENRFYVIKGIQFQE